LYLGLFDICAGGFCGVGGVGGLSVGGVGGVLGGSSGLWFVGVKLNTVEKVGEMAIGEPEGTTVLSRHLTH
jgi:hypothetical protein